MVQPKFSQEAKRLIRAADRINRRIAAGHVIEFHGLFVKTSPEEKILRASMLKQGGEAKAGFQQSS